MNVSAGDDAVGAPPAAQRRGGRSDLGVPPAAQRRGGEERRMNVVVNEKQVQVDDQTTVAALLASLGYPDRGIAVALDQAVLPRSCWATALSDGARLEVVTAVQGG